MIQTLNPATGKPLVSYPIMDESRVSQLIELNRTAYGEWSTRTFGERGERFHQMATLLRSKEEVLAMLITTEMGKIISEARAEIQKCAWLCDHYADYSEALLKEETISSDATKSYVRFDPLGAVFAIMPWNFPFWQVFRAAVPTMMGGNTFILKHAPNVWGCAAAIEALFSEAGFPEHAFTNLQVDTNATEQIISHPHICGVTLTGSARAGRSVAALAGAYLKKSVMELGGSDPYIVLKDGDINQACSTGTCSRMLNAGQVCIAAKRFIIEAPLYNEFVKDQKALLERMKVGDPLNEDSEIGPMARIDLLEQLERQVQESVKMGATIVTGGKRKDDTLYYMPTLLVDVTTDMPVYRQETFGPVSVVLKVNSPEEAVAVANDTTMGLGASLWTNDLQLAEKMAAEIIAGAVFINGMTKSDPRLPFGGTRQSGFGRELGPYGIKEFLNIKTVWVK